MLDTNDIECTITCFSTYLVRGNGLFQDENVTESENFPLLDYCSMNEENYWWDWLSDNVKEALFKGVIADNIGNIYLRAIDPNQPEANKRIRKQQLWDKRKKLIIDELNKEEEYIVKKSKYKLYKLRNKNKHNQDIVCAVYALEKPDFENKWIQTLIDILVKEYQKDIITMPNKLRINLVLHDKDIAGKYELYDSYVIHEKQELESLIQDTKLLKKIDLHIAFFKHTNNRFVKILQNNELEERNVNKEIKEAMDNHLFIDKLIDIIDQIPYIENSETLFCDLQNTEIVDELQTCNNEIEKIEVIKKKILELR